MDFSGGFKVCFATLTLYVSFHFVNKKLGIMTLTSWLKYDHEINKTIIYVYSMIFFLILKINT